jgi:hypothetical protein
MGSSSQTKAASVSETRPARLGPPFAQAGFEGGSCGVLQVEFCKSECLTVEGATPPSLDFFALTHRFPLPFPPKPRRVVDMPAQPSTPQQFRCLRGVVIGLLCAFSILVLDYAHTALCSVFAGSASELCAPLLPDIEASWGWVALLLGAGRSIYRAYRDFFEGDYYLDLLFHTAPRLG